MQMSNIEGQDSDDVRMTFDPSRSRFSLEWLDRSLRPEARRECLALVTCALRRRRYSRDPPKPPYSEVEDKQTELLN